MSESFDKVDYSAQKAASLAKLANYGSAAQDAYAMRAAQNHERAKAIRQSLRAEHQPTAGPYQQWNDPDAIYRDGERGHAVQEFNRLSHQPWNSGATELYHTNAMEAAFGRAYAGLDDWMTAAAAENAADAARRGGGGGWGGGGWGGGGGGDIIPITEQEEDDTSTKNDGKHRVKSTREHDFLSYRGMGMHQADMGLDGARETLEQWWMASAPDHYEELTRQFEEDRKAWSVDMQIPLNDGTTMSALDAAVNVAAEARFNGAGPAEVAELIKTEFSEVAERMESGDFGEEGHALAKLINEERDKTTNFTSDPMDNLVHAALFQTFPVESWEELDDSELYAMKIARTPDGNYTTLGEQMQRKRNMEEAQQTELDDRLRELAASFVDGNPTTVGYVEDALSDEELAAVNAFRGSSAGEIAEEQLLDQQAFRQALQRKMVEDQMRREWEMRQWEAKQAEYERLEQERQAEAEAQAYREYLYRKAMAQASSQNAQYSDPSAPNFQHAGPSGMGTMF